MSTSANPKEIKKSYYQLAKKYHPDALKRKKSKADSKDGAAKSASKESDEKPLTKKEIEEREKLFKQITEAYQILSNVDLRKKYDRLIFGTSSVDETSRDFEN